jgi:hypothetical protein
MQTHQSTLWWGDMKMDTGQWRSRDGSFHVHDSYEQILMGRSGEFNVSVR